jgi:uncharacterized protein YacL
MEVRYMPDLGPGGRGGARRRTRRRMMAVNEMQKSQEQPEQEQPETEGRPDYSDKLVKLARLLKDKGVITEEEYNLLFG